MLRKIIRRALRHVEKLNPDSPRPFLSFMAGEVRANMRSAYPELEETSRRVDAVLNAEESRFSHTVQVGLKHLLDDIAPLGKPKAGDPAPVYGGEKAFRLYDTFGLPRIS